MAGKKGRSGRKRQPLEEHLRRGTYRRDRHGELPPHLHAVKAPLVQPSSTEPVTEAEHEQHLTGLGAAGRALMLSHLRELTDWSARDIGFLRQAAEARDRQVELTELIGKLSPTQVTPVALLRLERSCGSAVVTALARLDIREDENPAPARPADPLAMKYLSALPARRG